VAGFRDGNIELHSVGGRGAAPAHRFEDTPSSPVVRLLPGPRQTLIAGFASGVLGVWDLANGSRLHHDRLHGALTHLLLTGDHLLAATDLGQHRTLDLSVFTRPRCEVLRQIWSRVEVVWEGGQPVRRAPDPPHPCLAR